MRLKRYNSIGKEELNSAVKVLKSGILSDFVGTSGKNFDGGKYVRKFEKRVQKDFKVKYAISVNSWTSGLICSIGAIDPSPGDEIICTPWTMCACATAILHWNCIPVFVDINKSNFNYDLKQLRNKITSKTVAILAVDIFGQSENLDAIKKIIKNRNIKIISDTAQAIGSMYKNKFSGTVADIGGYSFNYHKHINTGEGGMIVTNNKNLAQRCKLIRNHGEAVIKKNDKSSTESSKPKKDCPSGKILNPKTNRCRKIKTPKKKVIKDNLTTEEKPKKECPPEKIINPKTGRCIKKPKEKTHKKTGEPKKGVKSTPAPEKSLSKNFDESLEHIRTTGKVGSYRNFLNGIKKKFGIILKYDNHGDDYAVPDLYFMKGKKEAGIEEMEKVMKYVIDASKKV